MLGFSSYPSRHSPSSARLWEVNLCRRWRTLLLQPTADRVETLYSLITLNKEGTLIGLWLLFYSSQQLGS